MGGHVGCFPFSPKQFCELAWTLSKGDTTVELLRHRDAILPLSPPNVAEPMYTQERRSPWFPTPRLNIQHRDLPVCRVQILLLPLSLPLWLPGSWSIFSNAFLPLPGNSLFTFSCIFKLGLFVFFFGACRGRTSFLREIAKRQVGTVFFISERHENTCVRSEANKPAVCVHVFSIAWL